MIRCRHWIWTLMLWAPSLISVALWQRTGGKHVHTAQQSKFWLQRFWNLHCNYVRDAAKVSHDRIMQFGSFVSLSVHWRASKWRVFDMSPIYMHASRKHGLLLPQLFVKIQRWSMLSVTGLWPYWFSMAALHLYNCHVAIMWGQRAGSSFGAGGRKISDVRKQTWIELTQRSKQAMSKAIRPFHNIFKYRIRICGYYRGDELRNLWSCARSIVDQTLLIVVRNIRPQRALTCAPLMLPFVCAKLAFLFFRLFGEPLPMTSCAVSRLVCLWTKATFVPFQVWTLLKPLFYISVYDIVSLLFICLICMRTHRD